MHELAALVLLDIAHLEDAPGPFNHAVIAHLTAHFGVHGGLVQNQNGIGPGYHFVPQLFLGNNGQQLTFGDKLFIANKLRLGDILAELHAGPAQIAQGLARLSGAGLLLLHQLVKGLLVHRHTGFLHHLLGQVDGETVGIIQFEGVGA